MPVDELGDVSLHRARHESAGYAVRNRAPRWGRGARLTLSFHSSLLQVFGKAVRTLRSACSGGSRVVIRLQSFNLRRGCTELGSPTAFGNPRDE